MGDPVSLIMAALVAGAAKTAGEAVHDAYKGLKELIKRKFEGDALAQAMVDAKPEDIKQAEGLLKNKITQAGADKDEEILKAAQKVMEKEDPEGAVAGKYNINIKGGVQNVVGTNQGNANQTVNYNG